MEAGYLIPIDKFCTSHNIEISFISSLQESGLIEITTIKESALDINLEGIETVNYLLQRINVLQDEITLLKNKLGIYETEF
jgi:hypothetical protein